MALRNETKTCPVCNAAVFADMDTCFNCMHRFEGKEAVGAHAAGGACTDGAVKISGEVLQGILGRSDARGGVVEATPRAAEGVACRTPAAVRAPCEEDAPEEALRRRGQACLLGEFLVEFEGFLRNFLVDRKVDV